MIYDCFDPKYAQEQFMPCATWDAGSDLQRFGENHYLSAAPRSNHPGGVVAAQLDGSVLFLPNSVDARALALRICTFDGQQAELSQLQ